MKAGWLAAILLAFASGTWARETSVVPPPRQSEELVQGWQFQYRDGWAPDSATAEPGGWQVVALPHTWNRLGEYRESRTSATDNRQGTGWYRRVIDGRALDPGRRHFAEFDAVGNVADVWLNGRHLGTHRGAFTRFRFELTDALKFNESNVLLVRADNSDPQPGSTTQDVVPLLGDFFIHGGMYRPARLVSVSKSHFALDDYGGPGVYATPHLVPDGSARIAITARISGGRKGMSVIIKVSDGDQAQTARATRMIRGAEREIDLALTLPKPRLWDGLASPHLYELTAQLVEGGRVIDELRQPLGIREARFDPRRGFILNGRVMPLRGVSRHQDRLGKGWAITPADEEQDMALIAEMGANSIRVAHYPQSRHWFDLADRTGMVLWAEVPFVNKVSFGGAGTAALAANARQQMTEMIRQYSNHPSIVTWGIGNEVDLDVALRRIPVAADPAPLLRELHALARREDPSRPTTYADCCEATPGEKPAGHQPLTGIADLAGYNRYYGWYYGQVGDLGPHLDMLHARYPEVPLSVSEYGAGGALTQHSNHPEGRPTDSGGRPQPEEFESWWHESTWPQIRARPWLWGSWIWNMFDFSSRVRQEGDATDINTKGLVSYDRAIRKDAFYYFKAQWSPAPVLRITSRRHEPRREAVTRIKIYSNAPSVMLTFNDVDLPPVPCVDRVCTVEPVTLKPGRNTVVASAIFDAGTMIDRVEWTLAE